MVCTSLAFFGIQAWFGPSAEDQKKTQEQKIQVRKIAEEKVQEPLVQTAKPQEFSLSAGPSEETFYVLENEFQQLVFSTKGGSLAEINLPMKQDGRETIVKEIDVDRQILKQAPQNSRFPLYPHFTSSNKQKKEGTLGGYYPLLRRAVLKADGSAKTAVPPEYYATNIVGDDPAIGRANYKVTRFEPNLIQFESANGKRKIVKTYTLSNDKHTPYCFNLDIRIDGNAGDTQGLWLSSGVPEVELVGGAYSPLLKYQTTRSHQPDVESIDLPKKGTVQVMSAKPNWISNSNGFLGLIIDPTKPIDPGYQAVQIEGNLIPTRLSLINPSANLHPAANYPGYATYLPLKSGSSLSFRIFAGPYDGGLLKTVSDAAEQISQQQIDPEYESAQGVGGWFSFISEPFAKFLFMLMQFFYAMTHSWAASIILLTVALRIMMYPLNAWSIRSSIRMQEIAPKVKAVQDKYKKDPKKAQMEVMNLYRESGINPMTGCFPVLLQMPFLIGMFYLLKSSIQLRGAVFIPGWIDDLAAPDVLFTWSQPIWFIGNEFHLLPILMGLSMFLQQRLTSKLPKDPKQLSDSQKQQKMMGNLMSVLFTVMFYNFPSGLNLYFMFSTLLGILQQWWMMKRMEAAPKKKK
jgi:YidC/Oxa1 family membrane protein insertase